MCYRSILVGAFLLLSACSSDVVDINAKSKNIGSVETKPTAADNLAKKKTESERIADEANSLLETLTARFEEAQSKWTGEFARIKDSRERQAQFESRPCLKYADQLVELAEKYPDTEAAKLAWPIAAKYGMGETKSKASDAVLAAAIAESCPDKSMESLEFLMKYAWGEPQKEAMELMLSRALDNNDPDAAFDIIRKIVSSRAGR